MDLGIRGRKAIVCASSQGLGKGCALALAEAGVSLVINGRNRPLLERTAEEIRASERRGGEAGGRGCVDPGGAGGSAGRVPRIRTSW